MERASGRSVSSKEVALGRRALQALRWGAGVGRDLSISTQLWVNYRLETIRQPAAPGLLFAGFSAGNDLFSAGARPQHSVHAEWHPPHDTRDHPIYRRAAGSCHSVRVQPGAGRDHYDYKIEFDASRWGSCPPWDSVELTSRQAELRPRAALRALLRGRLQRSMPDRVLCMNFDRRPAPFLGTDIVEVRTATTHRFGAEYRIPLSRGTVRFTASTPSDSERIRLAARRDLTNPPFGTPAWRASRSSRWQRRSSHGYQRGRFYLRFLEV